MNSEQIQSLGEAARNIYYASEDEAVQSPFVAIGGVLIAIAAIFGFIKLPRILDDNPKSSFRIALQHENLRLGIIGIFVYVGAEVAIGSYLTNYFLSMDLQEVILASPALSHLTSGITSLFSGADFASLDEKAIVGTFVIFYWGSAMVGQFTGSYLTKSVKPAKVLRVFALSAIALLFITLSTKGLTAMWCALDSSIL